MNKNSSSSNDFQFPPQTLFPETGSPVFLSAVWRENNVVNVSCASRGWYPKPSLSWSHEKQALTPDSVKFSQDSNGLFTVHSWLLVSSSPEVSCSVSLFGDEAKEARLYLDNPLQPGECRNEKYFSLCYLISE